MSWQGWKCGTLAVHTGKMAGEAVCIVGITASGVLGTSRGSSCEAVGCINEDFRSY